MTFTIYCHTSPSGKRYVGQTEKTIESRWRQHVFIARRNDNKGSRAFHAAIRKYGEKSFAHETLETVSSQAEANAAEIKWVSALGSLVPHGYNLNAGGDNKSSHPDTRARIRAAMALIPVEERLARSRKANAVHSAKQPEERSEIARRRQAARDPVERSESARRIHARRTPEERTEISSRNNESRSEKTRLRFAAMTQEQRSAIALKASRAAAACSPESRRAAAAKRWAALSPEQRSARARKAVATKRARKATSQ